MLTYFITLLFITGCDNTPVIQDPTSSPVATRLTALPTKQQGPITVEPPTKQATTEPDDVYAAPPRSSKPIELNYSLDDNPFDSEGIMKQLNVYVGGGGESEILFRNCPVINDPTADEKSSRPLQPLRKDPLPTRTYLDFGYIDTSASGGCVCGVREGDEITTTLHDPTGKNVLSETFGAELGESVNYLSLAVYSDGTTRMSNSCIAITHVHDYGFVPGDPLGTYSMSVVISGEEFTQDFWLIQPEHPMQYYAPQLEGYVLTGFQPLEDVVTVLYQSDGSFLNQEYAISVKLDNNGSALISSGNPDYEPITVRGWPTQPFFEVWEGNFQLEIPGDQVRSLINWDYLYAQFPDNPYIYYYSEQLDRALAVDPTFSPALFARGLEFVRENALFGITIESNSIERAFRLDSKGNRQVNSWYFDIDLVADAIADISLVLDVEPENIVALIVRGIAYAYSGQSEEALKDFNAVIQSEPELAIAYSLKAEVLYHLLAQPDEAVLVLKQAWPFTNANASAEIAELAHIFGDDNVAIDFYSRAIELETDSFFKEIYLEARAKIHEELGNYSEAKSDYRTAAFLLTDMTLIPEGEFLMGTNPGDFGTESVERPQHSVYLDAFYIDTMETTVEAYNLCIRAGTCPGGTLIEPSNSAVTDVSWVDAQRYCTWLGKRLPTEAEWEKASRGDDQRLYPWGNEVEKLNSCKINYNDTNSGVESFTRLQSGDATCYGPYGLNNAVGNAWEWVADYFSDSYYSSSPYENPQGPDVGQDRVLRGGGWSTNNPAFLRVTNRWSRPEDFTRDDIGFRCAMSIDP